MLRAFLVAYAIVAYTALALVQAMGAPRIAYAALVPAFVVLVWVVRATGSSEPSDAERPRAAARVVATGSLVAFAGALAWRVPEGRLAAALGAGAASLAALVALGRIRAEEGLVARLASKTNTYPALGVSAVAWAAAATLTAIDVFAPELAPTSPRDASGLAVSIAALGSTATTLATGVLDLRRRRLELGAVDRLRAFVVLAAAFVGISVLAGALRLLHLPTLFVLSSLATAIVGAAVSVTRSPETVGRLATQLAVLAIVAVIPAVVLAATAKHSPWIGPLAVFGAASLAALGGLAAPALARVLLPRTEPWTRAFEAASRAAIHPDPEPALERALVELRGLSTRKLEAPSLFRFEPSTVTTVDLAGYARTEDVTIPDAFATLADGETERVVTRETLELASVRRPEVRTLLTWLEDRRLRAVAVIRDDDVATGMLGLPASDRTTPLTLPEVRALGHLARLLGAQLSAAAKLARAQLRERDATDRASVAAVERDAYSADLSAERRRGDAVCRVLAARARLAMYSPASRLAVESLEGHADRSSPLSLIVPGGMDPLPYLAVFHLASDRKSSALYVVDARNPQLTDLELWRSPTDSPLLEAAGGTLAILDPQLLPKLVQAYVATAYDAARDEPRDRRAILAIVVPRTLDVLVARGVMDERLADVLGDRTIALPPLAARGEDLRALVLDRLTKLGLDRLGRPLGIEPSAMAMLADHDWPGNDVELDSVLVRVAASVDDGDLVRKRDLVRLGFTVSNPARMRAS